MSAKSLAQPREQVARIISSILLDILGMVIDRLAGEDKKARAAAQRLWRRYGRQMMQDLRQGRMHPKDVT